MAARSSCQSLMSNRFCPSERALKVSWWTALPRCGLFARAALALALVLLPCLTLPPLMPDSDIVEGDGRSALR